MKRLIRLSVFLLGVVLCVGLTGCADSGPATAKVTGTLTIDGEPADNVTITLVPQDSSLPTASGPVKNGSFELYSGAQGKPGAVPGKYKVVLAQAAGGGETPDYMQAGPDEATGTPEQDLPFPEKYTAASSSDKEVEITPGTNDLSIEISGS